jgi:GAF domain-containing protein
MKRRSRTGAGSVKPRRRKAATPKRSNASNAARDRGASIAGQETVVARLTRERDEALLRETANSEILRLISSSPGDLELVFRIILEDAARICNANFGTLFRFDGENLYPVAQFNTPAALLEAQTRRGPFKPAPGTTMEHVIRTKQVSHSADKAAEPVPGFFAEHGGARTQVVVPMLKDDALIGAIGIYRQEVRPFAEKQIELVKNFAAQAVIAIENARLLKELRESLQQQTATADVLRVISSSPGELQPVFQAILGSATGICEAKFGNLWLREGDAFRIAATHGAPPAYREYFDREPLVHPHPKSGLGVILETKRLVHIADVKVETTFKDKMRIATIELANARSLGAVPLLKENEVIGAIAIYRQEVRPFTDKQIELLQNFAAQAVIAIENARLVNELRLRTADLSEALEQQTATSEVLRVISSSQGNLQPVFQAMLESAARLCDANFGNIFRLDGEVLHLVATYNTPAAFDEARRRSPLARGQDNPIGKMLATKTVLHVTDLAADPRYIRRVDRSIVAAVELGGVRTFVAVPMLNDNEMIGALIVYRQEVRPFTDKQIELVKNFAAQAVIAIENARLLSELRESLQQQTAAAEVLKVISSSPGDLTPVFEAILVNAVNICGAKFGNLFLCDDDEFTIVAMYGAPAAVNEWWRANPTIRPGPHTGLARLVTTKQVNQTEDLRAGVAYAERDPLRVATVELAGARTLIDIPLLKDDVLVGAIVIYRQEVRLFADKEVELLTNFAAQAVIAIENARLLNELRESLEQQTATADVLRIISSSPGDLEPVFVTILDKALHLCEAAFGFVTTYDGERFERAAQRGVPDALAAYFQTGMDQPRPGDAHWRLVEGEELIHSNQMDEDAYRLGNPLRRAVVDLGGARTALVVALRKDKVLLGALTVYRKEVRPFTDQQVSLVQNFAAQAVIAIENARLLSELRQRTEEVVKLNQQLEARVADQVGEIERMGRLRRFLPPQVADLIVASGTEKQLESHRREITALFCDLRGFTGFSESADPEDVMSLLRQYHEAIGKIIIKYSGTLERYAGDGVMVVFNDPVPADNPALQAVRMALDMRAALGALIEKWRRLGHELGFGIGIAHGYATLGTIGFEGRFDYAAIGTVSNVASRLCDEAKPGQILISPRVLMAIEDAIAVEPVGDFVLKGITRPLAAYNVVGAK